MPNLSASEIVPRKHRLKYVRAYTDRHGRPRVYLKRGDVSIPLREQPGSAAFMEEYWRAYRATEGEPPAPLEAETPKTRRQGRAAFVRYAERLAKFARSRSTTKGLECTVTAAWIIERIEEQDYRCRLTGLPFKKPGDTLRGEPLTPSLDRIDNRLGYTPENVRVVCLAVNVAMNQWGYDTLLRISKAVARQHNANLRNRARAI